MREIGSAPRILVISPAWVGDMIMAQSLFKVLKTRQPQAWLSVAAPAFTAQLATRMPEVDEVIEIPFHHGKLQLNERYRLGCSLRARSFDHAIILPGSTKAALLPFFARIPVRSGYCGEPRWGLVNDLRPKPIGKKGHMAAQFVQLGLPPDEPLVSRYPAPQLTTRPRATPDIMASLNLKVLDNPILALCPGAEYGPAKCWPSHHFAALANHYLQQDWQIWLVGSDKDQSIAQAIIDICKIQDRCLNLAGRTSLLQAVDLLAQARAVVSNDSGLMHVAAATGRPVVGIFGSSSSRHTPPLSHCARAISLELSCQPCFARQCPLGHLDCLEKLAPQQVIDTLEGLLAEPHTALADIISPNPFK